MGISPGERVRKLKAMFASGTMVSMQLSPLVSIKSWRVMAVGSMWCSRNGRIKACKTHQTPWKHKILNTTTGLRVWGRQKGWHSLKRYLSKNRKIDWTPRVGSPVNESRRKVCCEYSCNWEVQMLRRRNHRTTVFQVVVFFSPRCYLQILSRMNHKCPKWKLASRWMKLKAMREKQRTTLIHSWHLLPKGDSMCKYNFVLGFQYIKSACNSF